MILAIHLHVVQMLFVMETVFAHAFLSIEEILIKVVDLNAYWTLIVQETKHAYEINVSIHVLEHVDKTQFVM